MYKKIFSTSILNTVTACVNLLSNLIIVKTLSLEIFGEYAIFSSYLAFGGLIYSLIPGNFSIFKMQDDKEYKVVLLSFFLLSNLFFLLFSIFFYFLNLVKVDIYTIFFFGTTTYFLGYFDIKFQALGKLNKYFLMLFFVAILKIVAIGLFYYLEKLQNLTNLLWIVTFVQLVVILYYLRQDKIEIKYIIRQKNIIKITVFFIKDNFSLFKDYYLYTFFKKIRENSIVLIFSRFSPIDVIGLFALFVKITSFVLGLSRTLEAFFMNRGNIEKYKVLFYEKIFYFSFFIQLLFLGIGLIYLKLFVNEYYFLEIFALSFLAYPQIYFLLARSEMLSNFKNKEGNISEIIYILIVLFGTLLSLFFNFKSIHSILTIFILANFGLQFYMIFNKSRTYKK